LNDGLKASLLAPFADDPPEKAQQLVEQLIEIAQTAIAANNALLKWDGAPYSGLNHTTDIINKLGESYDGYIEAFKLLNAIDLDSDPETMATAVSNQLDRAHAGLKSVLRLAPPLNRFLELRELQIYPQKDYPQKVMMESALKFYETLVDEIDNLKRLNLFSDRDAFVSEIKEAQEQIRKEERVAPNRAKNKKKATVSNPSRPPAKTTLSKLLFGWMMLAQLPSVAAADPGSGAGSSALQVFGPNSISFANTSAPVSILPPAAAASAAPVKSTVVPNISVPQFLVVAVNPTSRMSTASTKVSKQLSGPSKAAASSSKPSPTSAANAVDMPIPVVNKIPMPIPVVDDNPMVQPHAPAADAVGMRMVQPVAAINPAPQQPLMLAAPEPAAVVLPAVNPAINPAPQQPLMLPAPAPVPAPVPAPAPAPEPAQQQAPAQAPQPQQQQPRAQPLQAQPQQPQQQQLRAQPRQAQPLQLQAQPPAAVGPVIRSDSDFEFFHKGPQPRDVNYIVLDTATGGAIYPEQHIKDTVVEAQSLQDGVLKLATMKGSPGRFYVAVPNAATSQSPDNLIHWRRAVALNLDIKLPKNIDDSRTLAGNRYGVGQLWHINREGFYPSLIDTINSQKYHV
jgi:hypothetical protein